MRIGSHDVNQSDNYRYRRPAIQRLRENERVPGICEFAAVVLFVVAGNNERLPMTRNDRVEARSGLTQEAMRTNNWTELLRAMIPRYGSCQLAHPNAVPAR
jgi:hypothetical protein